jgi:hypothetical protein
MSLRARVYSRGSRFAATVAAGRGPRFASVCAAPALALLLAGCPSQSSTSSTKPDPKAGAKATALATAAENRCTQLLMSGLEMLKPGNMGISAQEQQVVDALNNWAGECGNSTASPANDPPAAKGATPTATAKGAGVSASGAGASTTSASGGASADAFADLYDLGDIEHIRDSWLVKDLGTAAVKAEPTDLERAVALFDLAVRTVSLNNAGDPELPQTIYDILVIGRGTAEDRAWLFGELLRQAGIDAVIVRPNAAAAPAAQTPAAKAADSKTADAKTGPTATKTASGAEPRWLVGALVDKQVYLFDPTLGWPIPSPDDKGITPTVRQPATLAQAAAHDELLRKLDVSPEKKYPLKASDLKSVKVEIITSGRYSEPRIKRIETFLAGSRSVVVYTPLADVGARPGLRSRVESGGAGGWKKEDVSVWDYPDRQLAAVHHLGDQTKIVHDAFWLPFEGPVEFEFDAKTMQFKIAQGTTITSLKGGKPARPQAGAIPAPGEENNRVEVRHDSRVQLKARIAQLQGDFPQAIRKYLTVQLDELPDKLVLPEDIQERAKSLPPDKRPKGPLAIETPKREWFMNFRAAEDAKFWMGVCQLEQHEMSAAEETFEAYIRRYSQGGVGTWIMQAAYLRSLALAEMKKFALAVQAARQLAEALPENDYRRPTFELLGVRWRNARDAAKPTSSTASPTPVKSATEKTNTEKASTEKATAEKSAAEKPAPKPKTP